MFAKVNLVSLATASLALLAVAAPSPTDGGQCNTGNLQCCQTTQSATTAGVSELLGLLGVVLGDIEGLIGLNCSPINVSTPF